MKRRSNREVWLRRRAVSAVEILPGWGLNFTTLGILAWWHFTFVGVISAALMGQLVGFAFNQLMVDRWIFFINKYGGEYAEVSR